MSLRGDDVVGVREGFGLQRVDVRATVAVGAEQIANVPTSLHRSALFPSEAGLLGNSILSNYRVTIDAVNGRLLLQRS